ncbi:MAG: hypothetical protein ACK4MD_10800 [Demequina sp.]
MKVSGAVWAVGIAGVFTLAPAAAHAQLDYPESAGVLQCDIASAVPGGNFGCEIDGPDGSQASLAGEFSGEGEVGIAGATSTAAETITGGIAPFTVSVPRSSGTLSLTALIDGEPVDTITLAVGTPTLVQPAELSAIGLTNAPLLAAVVMLLAGGGLAVVFASRRPSLVDAHALLSAHAPSIPTPRQGGRRDPH